MERESQHVFDEPLAFIATVKHIENIVKMKSLLTVLIHLHIIHQVMYIEHIVNLVINNQNKYLRGCVLSFMKSVMTGKSRKVRARIWRR